MKNFRRILSYTKSYKAEIAFAIFFNLLLIFFSIFSVAMLIPILGILFNDTASVTEPVAYQGLANLKDYLQGTADYYITHFKAEMGVKGVLLWVLIIAGFAFVLKNLAKYIAIYYLIRIKNGVERDIRNVTHRKILELPLSFFDNHRKGDIIARLTSDIQEVQWAVLASIQKIIQDPLMIIATLVVMLALSVKMTLVVLVMIPITGLVISGIGNTLKRPSEKAKKELGVLMSYIEEHITGLSIIKSFVAEKRMQQRYARSNENLLRYQNKMMSRQDLSHPISETMGSFVILGIIWFGSTLILDTQELNPSTFIAFIALFYQIITPAKNITKGVYDIKRGDASAQRIFEILDYKNTLEDADNAQALNQFEHKIQFQNVSFKYADEWVLNDVSFTLEKGKTIALVGQSGSGKTTIVSLMNRFYDVSDGAILLDGIDIRKIQKNSLRRLISYITQDSILFNGSVMENIEFSTENVSENDIAQAAAMANADQFIDKLDGKMEYNIGDAGNKLSGGQKQRLTIARAILKNPPILLLDEATSALDSESERLVQNALNNLMTNRTAIIIAHRLSTIQHADEILVMKNGEIVERGNHDGLIEANGEYSKLVRLQEL